jgi:hypothetical protein
MMVLSPEHLATSSAMVSVGSEVNEQDIEEVFPFYYASCSRKANTDK